MARQGGKLIVYLGGIRSGKSELAQRRVMDLAGKGEVAYLATAGAPGAKKDAELSRRLERHRQSRPAQWLTLEGWKSLLEPLKMASKRRFKALLLDGLGMHLARQLELPEAQVLDEIEVFCKSCRFQAAYTVVVADEVGQGGVPGHPVARQFADLNGKVNQQIARAADEVWLVQAGLGTRLK